MLKRLDISSRLRTGRTETGMTQRRPFSALVVGEVACAVVLTVCGGLLVRSFLRVQSLELGFEPEKVLTAYLRTNYFEAKGIAFWRNVLQQAASVPGAQSAAVSDCMPAERAMAATVAFSDRVDDPSHASAAEACWISADYFRTLGSPLLRGRFFGEHDTDTAQPVVIINVEAAHRFFPNEDPVGRRIAANYLALGSRVVGPARFREIVGVVGNSRQQAVEQPSGPAIYMPYEQDESYHVLASMNLFIRTAGPAPFQLASGLRAKIHAAYPNQPLEQVTVMREVVSRTLGRRVYSLVLITGFAVLALLLCGIGLYGVVSYVTLQRTREFGIRMALGATRANVLVDVLQRGGSLVAVGSALGIVVSVAATRLISQLLFETAPLDPVIFFGAVALLVLIGALACLLPGIRAAQLDPREALTSE
jgi:predicted permease